ncbi:Uncharacterised protein [Mycobacterium tuberculosis]|nr:Uncharacterised protein [Mycobacterium tuberculosis]
MRVEMLHLSLQKLIHNSGFFQTNRNEIILHNQDAKRNSRIDILASIDVKGDIHKKHNPVFFHVDASDFFVIEGIVQKLKINVQLGDQFLLFLFRRIGEVNPTSFFKLMDLLRKSGSVSFKYFQHGSHPFDCLR